jgi:hypothetical protein
MIVMLCWSYCFQNPVDSDPNNLASGLENPVHLIQQSSGIFYIPILSTIPVRNKIFTISSSEYDQNVYMMQAIIHIIGKKYRTIMA